MDRAGKKTGIGLRGHIGGGRGIYLCHGPLRFREIHLLYACSGMDSIDGGNISFCGRELSSFREKELADLRRTQMGFVFQQPSLLKNLNILDNIVFPSLRDHRKNAGQLMERAKELMERTGISQLEKRKVTQVSGGQLQRAGICRALMNQPEIVFGDEPTGALNSRASAESWIFSPRLMNRERQLCS